MIVGANGSTELFGATGKEVQRHILRVVADLSLSVLRMKELPSRRPKNLCQSPAKITCRYDSDTSDESADEEEEIAAKTEQMTLNPRLKGMSHLLRYDDGIRPVTLIQDGRDFVYSGSCRIRISGKSKINMLLFSVCAHRRYRHYWSE